MVAVEFRILGTVEAVLDGEPMSLPRAQLRGTLGYLLTHANRHVSVAELIDALWGGAAPATARAQVYTMVAHLRRTFRDLGEPERLRAHQSGYLLTVGRGELDADVFADLRAEAASAVPAAELATAEELLVRSLALWRGRALKDATGSYVDGCQAQLEEKRLLAEEDLAEVRLRQGKHRELAAELHGLVARHPYRESMFRPYLLALYRCAREPEALAAGRALSRRLADEYGTDLTDETRALITAILRHDPSLEWRPPDRPPRRDAAVPPRASALAHSGLPYRSSFVGRLPELAEMDAALAHAARRERGVMLLLHGRPGAGKTSLAVEWAHRRSGEFPDGVLYHRVRGRDAPSDDLRMRDPDANFLLVVDGAVSSSAMRRWLPASTRATVLVLSRRRLDELLLTEAAHPVRIGPMCPDDAVALLENTVVHAHRLVDRPTLLDLAELCDHWPLALRIAAARISSEPGLTAADLVSEMSEPSAVQDCLRMRSDGYSIVEALKGTADLLSVLRSTSAAPSPRA